MLRHALFYPWRDTRLGPALIGCVVFVLGLLFFGVWFSSVLSGTFFDLPGLISLGLSVFLFVLSQGYLLRVFRASALGEEEPPRFGGWRSLMRGGLMVGGVHLVYTMVPVAVWWTSIVVMEEVTVAADGAFYLLCLVLLWSGYVLAGVLTHVALTNDIRAAVQVTPIMRAVGTRRYVSAFLRSGLLVTGFWLLTWIAFWVGYFTLFYGIGIVSSLYPHFGALLGIVFLVGTFSVWCWLTFSVQMSVCYLLGRSCGRTLTPPQADEPRDGITVSSPSSE